LFQNHIQYYLNCHPARQVDGTVSIPFTLIDSDSDNVDVEIQFSLGGGSSFQTAIPAATSPPISGLSTSPPGVTHSFVWDYGSQIGLGAKEVVVRVTPSDAATGNTHTTIPFIVGNDAPVATIVTISGGQSGNVAIPYTLFDSTADLASVQVEFSSDGGGSFMPATTQVSPTAFFANCRSYCSNRAIWTYICMEFKI